MPGWRADAPRQASVRAAVPVHSPVVPVAEPASSVVRLVKHVPEVDSTAAANPEPFDATLTTVGPVDGPAVKERLGSNCCSASGVTSAYPPGL